MIFTAGYEGLSIALFIRRAKEHGVETIVDVREYPLSRKPGFSKRSFAEHLTAAGINYVHVPALGCPRPIRNQYREDGSWAKYRAGFNKFLKSQQEPLAHLRDMAESSRCCLVCFEEDFQLCHRSLITTELGRVHGIPAAHITQAGIVKTEVATQAA